jgi:hypothetical protein
MEICGEKIDIIDELKKLSQRKVLWLWYIKEIELSNL